MGIRLKLLLIIGSIIFATLASHTYLQVNLQRSIFESELQKRISLMKENLYQRALSQAETLEHFAAEDIASYNLFALSNKLQQAAMETDELDYVIVIDEQNQVYIHTTHPEQQQTLYKEPKRTIKSRSTLPDTGYTAALISEADVETLIEYKLPIRIGETPWGSIILGYSLVKLNAQLVQSQQDNEVMLGKLNLSAFYIAATVLLVAFLLVSQISKRLIAPVMTLSQFAKDLAAGNFSNVHKITSTATDEVGILTRNFAEMAKKLDESNRQQIEYSQTLEKKVNERTKELNVKNDELTRAFIGLEESQQQLIHSEKMAALGQLIAGIAHEINTPLGAIQASVGNTSRYLSLFNEGLPHFCKSTNDAEKSFFCTLLAKAQSKETMSTREERKAKRQLLEILIQHTLDKPEELADMLADMGLNAEISGLLPSLSRPSSFQIVELAHHLTGIDRNNETIRTAIGRASKVVFALKHFTHHDITGDRILSDINQGIRTVLVLYQNLLKQGCDVIERFGELPEIDCYPDELNQVWTNIIHNALHAMQYKGTLTIETKQEGRHIRVTIADSGSGIPKAIQPKIYDSFFTTKSAGEGSGLGLGICKRIIDKHHGSIEFTSEPGKTVFMITLPISNTSIRMD